MAKTVPSFLSLVNMNTTGTDLMIRNEQLHVWKRRYVNSCLPLLFSADFSYGKGKYLNQTGFFYKICQELLFT